LLGLAVSIIAGSAPFLAIIERFPVVIWGGGALLGRIAGGLLPDVPAIAPMFRTRFPKSSKYPAALRARSLSRRSASIW
jgi:hypothetical protein